MALGGATAAGATLAGNRTPLASARASDLRVDPLSLVNPEFRPTLEKVLPMEGSFSLTQSSLPKVRRAMRSFSPPPLPAPKIESRLIPGLRGEPDVRIYMTGATPGGSKPAVVHMHGGGYVLGSAQSSARDIQELSLACGCVTISVDYRLAPETPFPGSLNDNYAALRWVYDHAHELGVDRDRIALKGESAGGGHAAALAIAARDRGEVPVVYQVLLYPMLDDRTGSTHRVPPFMGVYVWTAADNRLGWSALLGRPAGSARVPPGSVPARVADLAGLPAAFIGVGSIDLFADEDVHYARRLMDQAVPVELLVVPGGFHGFDVMVPQASLSREFTYAWQNALRRAFGHLGA